MANAIDALFDEGKTEPVTTQPEPEADKGPARDEHGRFAPKAEEKPDPAQQPSVAAPIEPATVPEPAKPAAPPEPKADPKADPFFIAMLDEREKRQKAERELADLKAQQQPSSIPSIQENPEAHAEYIRAEASRIAVNNRFDISEAMATQVHGEDTVKAAMEWGMKRSEESSAFAAEYIRQKHPVDWIVRQQKKDQLLSELGDDEAKQKAYIERRARELGLIPAAPTTQTPTVAAPNVPQPQPPKPVPTRSLAAAPATAGIQSIPTGPGAAFDSVIPA